MARHRLAAAWALGAAGYALGLLVSSAADLPSGPVPGLAPGVQARLFRPFFTTKNDGNGLGLWISLGLVERYGGGISAGSRADGQSGAVFSVRLLTEPQAPAAVNTRDGRPGG